MLKQPTIMLWVYTGPEHCSSHFSIFSSVEAYATLADRAITRAHATVHATGKFMSAAGLTESFRSSRGSSKGSSARTGVHISILPCKLGDPNPRDLRP